MRGNRLPIRLGHSRTNIVNRSQARNYSIYIEAGIGVSKATKRLIFGGNGFGCGSKIDSSHLLNLSFLFLQSFNRTNFWKILSCFSRDAAHCLPKYKAASISLPRPLHRPHLCSSAASLCDFASHISKVCRS